MVWRPWHCTDKNGIWAFAGEVYWIYWTKDVKYGAGGKRGRQPMRFVDAVKEEMQRVGLTEHDGTDGLK